MRNSAISGVSGSYLLSRSEGAVRFDRGYLSLHDQFDQKYKALQIEKRVKTFYASKKRYDQELQQIHRQREEYENVYIYYQSLCNLLQKDENLIYEKPADGKLAQMKASLQEEILS